MATVESDPVPNTVQPITAVDDAIVAAPPHSHPIDASEPHAEKDQQLDSTDTQLPVNGDATSLPEVTKLPPDQLDTVVDALFETKKLVDPTEPGGVIVDDDSKKEHEDTTTIHTKDSTADTSISDATTAVAEHETEDTPKDETRKDTHQHEDGDVGLGASITEGALIGSAASHDTVTEVGPAAEGVPPTAETSTSECEPAAGSVAESDPVISTAVETETPVTESEPSEPAQLKVDETPEVPKIEDSPTIDGTDNTDHKTKIEVEEDPITVSTATTEVHDGGEVAEITVEAPEGGGKVEVEQPGGPTIQIEAAEEEDSAEVSTHSSLNVEESPIGVEIIAPTPALVDNRDLEESDTEGATTKPEGSSTPKITTEEDMVSTGGTVTPHPEPEVDVSLVTVGEDGVGADAPVVEAPPPSIEDSEPAATTAPVEVIDGPQEIAVAKAPEAEEETSTDVTPAAEEPNADTPKVEAASLVDSTPEVPTEDQSIANEAPAVTADEPINDIPTATQSTAESIPEEQPAEVQPTPESDATEAVPVPETSAAAEAEVVPDTDKSVPAPEVETPAIAEETPVAEEIKPAKESVEVKEVEEQQQKEVTVEDTPDAEEPSVEDTQVIKEPPVELVTEAQEPEAQVLEDETTEPAEEQIVAIEASVPEAPVVPEESQATAVLDQDTPPVKEASVPATDDVVLEEAKPDVGEVRVRDFATEPSVAEETIGEVNASEEAVAEEPAAAGEEPVIEEPVAEPAVLIESVPETSHAEEPVESVTAPAVVEEVAVEKGEEVLVEEAPAPEPVSEVSVVSQPEVIVEEEQVEEERAIDEPTTHDISIPVEEPTAEPVVEAVVEDAVAEPVGGEPIETPDANIPPPEEPTTENTLAEPVVEESATEVLTVSDEHDPQEGHGVEEKSSDKDTNEQGPQSPVVTALQEPVVPEAAVESADAEKHMVEINAHSEVANVVLTEEPAPPASAGPNEEPVLDDSLIESDPVPETAAIPEVIVEEKKDSSEPVQEESVIEDVPTAEMETTEGSVVLEKPVLDIPESAAQIERPWTPSFQVTTIGQGASLPPDEEIPTLSPDDGAEEAKDVPPTQPAIVVEDEPTEASVDEVQAPTEQTTEQEPTSLSWTPSYSVHSQGSPSPTHASLEPETPAADNDTQSDVPPANDESTVALEETVPTEEKEGGPSMDTETPETPSVPQEESRVDEPQIADESEPPHELQTTETVVPVVEEPETQTEALTQEEAEDKGPEPLHAEVIEESFVRDPSSLTPPTEQDRPASPSWVPSYSVSRQGSPLPQQAPLPIPDAHIPEIELTSDPAHANDAEVVNDQGGEEDTSPAPPTVTVDDAQPKAAEENAQTEEEHPSTAWTPSYSVTHQGTDVLKETQLESLTAPSQPKEPEAQLRRSLSEEMEGSSAFSPTALIGAGVAGGAAVLAASATFGGSKDTQDDKDTKLNDGRTANGKAVSSPETLQDRVFPTVEIPSDTTRLSTGPLPALDENSALDTTSPLSPETSPVLSRKRLESTTSSRLFPGGWFSNTSKIPDERTSLEVAQGVFTATKQGSTTVEEALLSPAVDPITPVREQSSSDKRRWCIIM